MARAAEELRIREREEADARLKEILKDANIVPGQSAEEVRQAIMEAFRAHGEEPPTDFRWVAQFISAATARRGTRHARLLSVSARGTYSALRWFAKARAETRRLQQRHPDAETNGADNDGA